MATRKSTAAVPLIAIPAMVLELMPLDAWLATAVAVAVGVANDEDDGDGDGDSDGDGDGDAAAERSSKSALRGSLNWSGGVTDVSAGGIAAVAAVAVAAISVVVEIVIVGAAAVVASIETVISPLCSSIILSYVTIIAQHIIKERQPGRKKYFNER